MKARKRNKRGLRMSFAAGTVLGLRARGWKLCRGVGDNAELIAVGSGHEQVTQWDLDSDDDWLAFKRFVCWAHGLAGGTLPSFRHESD